MQSCFLSCKKCGPTVGEKTRACLFDTARFTKQIPETQERLAVCTKLWQHPGVHKARCLGSVELQNDRLTTVRKY